MWQSTGRHYDAVLYMRPDVLYTCPFPVDAIKHMQLRTLGIPDFHQWHGYNDRFAMGDPATAAIWGHRLTFTLATCTRLQVQLLHIYPCITRVDVGRRGMTGPDQALP